jgi:hypothetical protein
VGRIFLVTTLCALWAWSAYAEPLHAGLRVAEPADRSLLARVRGQTGDLEVTLDGIETSAKEASFAAQLEAARKLAGERGLRVMMWAVRKQGALEWVVADFALDRVLVRALSIASTPLELSAQEEAAALVARSALRASLAGSALGQPSEELAPQAPEPPVPEPPAPPPKPASPPPPAKTERPYGVELGVLSGIDGASAHGHHALFVRASLRWRGIELGALGAYGIPVAVRQSLASLHLGTHRVEGSAGLRFVHNHWSLTPSIAIGVQVLRLTADARDARLSAHDARVATLAIGGFARVAYQPGRVGVSLRLGLEVLPVAPALGYETDAGFARTTRLWRVQPQLGLALSL